ncbi:MAG: recombination mediator RecR [Armatimonadota bacterium]|nr:recombination mediator RecR [Armatimonadota bacterium]
MHYAKPLARLVGELEKLPGVGPKSAQRLAFHILRASEEEARMLSDSIIDVKTSISMCKICFNFTDQETCDICRDPKRDRSIICVVAEPRDLVAMEKTNEYHGLYHVLQGVISPMEGVGPDQLKIRELVGRLAQGEVREIILATNPTIEGDTTALYISRELRRDLPEAEIKISRIAHGMPVGGDLDYADQATLIQAMQWRREM